VSAIGHRVAALYDSRFLRTYARGKIAGDPAYAAVLDVLRGRQRPLLDLGCGVGMLAFFLREAGFDAPIVGIDHDAKKIAAAQEIAARYGGLTLHRADARDALDFRGDIVILDLLHYFQERDQRRIVESAARAAEDGGIVIVRDAVRDGSWRYRLTYAQESFSRAIGWLKAERLSFPERETIVGPFRERGFDVECLPLWGRTPFNNYLFVFRSPAGQRTRPA
jgi:SAM-dependent methyltransferase